MASLSPGQVQASFIGVVKPHRTPPAYVLGLVFALVAMILLPAIYLGLVGLVAWGTWVHATHHTGIVTAAKGRGAIVLFLIYAAPIVTGAILVLFMLKPLFARPARGPRAITLDLDRQPVLAALLRKLCALIGAPFPARVDVDTQVNASAGLRRGFFSIFSGKDLVLTIGLPLVAALSARQLVGVLSHELGHFTQGAGMRLRYLVGTVANWFARLVHERDRMDAAIETWSRELDIRIGFIFWIARCMVWLTRRILWVLLVAAHAIVTFLGRQGEYDADTYEIQVAGSESFRDTARLLPVLSAMYGQVLSSMSEAWSRKEPLADDLPQLVQGYAALVPDRDRDQFLRGHLARKGRAFDTHPPDQARIDRAVAARSRGFFTLDNPAADLVAGFPALCREATLALYEQGFGETLSARNLVATAKLMEESRNGALLHRYYQGHFDALHPLVPDGAGAPEDVAAATEELNRVRAEIARLVPTYGRRLASHRQASIRARNLTIAEALLRAGVPLDAKALELPRATPEAAAEERERAVARVAGLDREFEPLNRLLRRRLALSVAGGCRPMVEALAALKGPLAGAEELNRLANAGAALMESGTAGNRAALAPLDDVAARARRTLETMRREVSAIPDPLAEAGARVFLEARLPAQPAAWNAPVAIAHAKAVANALLDLHALIAGRLALAGEEAEAKLGLAPLPSP